MSAHEKGTEAGAISILDNVRKFQEGALTSEELAGLVIRAYLAGSGYVLAPPNATSEMMQAGVDRRRTTRAFAESLNGQCYLVYADMLEAYPQPFSQDKT